MAIKVGKNNLKVLVGKKPLSAVLVGATCVYGDDLSLYCIDYPACSLGVGLYISINGTRKIDCPTSAGRIDVHYGDNVIIRTYGQGGYYNPSSSVINRNEQVNGEVFKVSIDEESYERATKYNFVAKGNISLSVQPTTSVPQYSINIQKDAGIGVVTFRLYPSPYDIAYDSDSRSAGSSPIETNDSSYIVTYGSSVSTYALSAVRNEGYKFVSIDVDYTGRITQNGQCTITAVSEKGKTVSIICPALPAGTDSYSFSMVSSVYSKNCDTETPVYLGQSQQKTITTRTAKGIEYSFYEQDVILITATRKEGYKLPNLGKTGDVKNLTLTKQITLTGNTMLVVQSGEAGVKIVLENNTLMTGEYVLMDVKSEYNDGRQMVQNPPIYVGDEIKIPLNPMYRVGNMIKRKPGVGLSSGTSALVNVTFSEDIAYTIPSTISKLKVTLEQGADRIVSSSFNPSSRILNIRSEGTFTSDDWGQCGICDKVIPVKGLGEEGFFINSVTLIFYTKRYLGDIIGDKFYKHIYDNLPSSFSYGCTSNLGIYYKNVLTGTKQISDNKTSVTIKITEYNRNWVANTTHGVYIFANEIII